MTKKPKKVYKVPESHYSRNKDVRSLRTQEAITAMKWALRRHCTERDAIMFLVGINTGLRCGDLLRLKIEDVKGKKEIRVLENKTKNVASKKPRIIYLSAIYKELNSYIDSLGKSSGWLFPSRKGDSHISVVQAYRILNKAAGWAEVEHIGSHTMRKTFAYWLYKQTKNPELVMNALGHSAWEITRRYAGLGEEEIEEALGNFKL